MAKGRADDARDGQDGSWKNGMSETHLEEELRVR